MEFDHPQSLIWGDSLFVFLPCDLGHTSYLRIFHAHVFFPSKQSVTHLDNYSRDQYLENITFQRFKQLSKMLILEEKLSDKFFSKWKNREAVNVIFAEYSFRLVPQRVWGQVSFLWWERWSSLAQNCTWIL